MAAPEQFAETSNSFPLHRGRRPYMALNRIGLGRRFVRCWRKLTPHPRRIRWPIDKTLLSTCFRKCLTRVPDAVQRAAIGSAR